MRKYTFLLAFLILPACSELELGSHIAKQITLPSDVEKKVGDFKVGNPYRIKGRTYYPKEKYQYSETGVASWYGPGFHGKLTANGEIFNKYELTAAHRTLQMPSIVRVTNLENGRSIIVRVNDRGPFAHNRVIDLSQKAAELLGMIKKGTARVRVDVMEKESRQVAQAARDGRSTRGTEVVLNRGQSLDDKMPLQIAKPEFKPMISSARLTDLKQKNRAFYQSDRKFEQIITSQFYTENVPRKPVSQTVEGNKYFVRIGQFKTEDDAFTMKLSLGQPANVLKIAQNSYIVDIGPLSSQSATTTQNFLQSQGRSSQIITGQP